MTIQKAALYIGVDGGGTKCRVRIRNHQGKICSDANGGPANIYSDFDTAIAEIKKKLDHALAKLNPNNVSKLNPYFEPIIRFLISSYRSESNRFVKRYKSGMFK